MADELPGIYDRPGWRRGAARAFVALMLDWCIEISEKVPLNPEERLQAGRLMQEAWGRWAETGRFR